MCLLIAICFLKIFLMLHWETSEGHLGSCQAFAMERLAKIVNNFKRQPNKMVKQTQTTRRQLLTSCLSAFDLFVEMALKGLTVVSLV